MQAYGVYPQDCQGSWSGHNKFPVGRYYNHRRENARRRHVQKHRKTRARMLAQQAIKLVLTATVLIREELRT